MINGLALPAALQKALDDGTWDAAGKHWEAVFPADELAHPTLYSLELMRNVNEAWRKETRPEYLGAEDRGVTPGRLDPAQSVLIGELQGDTMIALDYRNEGRGPTVAFLNIYARWVKVADGFDDFWRRMTAGS
jgi:hypothetical protein